MVGKAWPEKGELAKVGVRLPYGTDRLTCTFLTSGIPNICLLCLAGIEVVQSDPEKSIDDPLNVLFAS